MLAVLCNVTVIGCVQGEGDREPIPGATSTAEPDETAHQPEELTRAAERVVGFLRGEAPFDQIALSDSVTLQLSPEGGGAKAVLTRERLRNRENWRISDDGTTYRLAPPPGHTALTTRIGRHFNCLEYPLASRAPELARLPHVGTMLRPPDPESCLSSWNLTLVFSAEGTPPTVVAAVYDQWEW